MKRVIFEIPIFDIDVALIQVESKEDKEDVLKFMQEHEATEAILEELDDTISHDRVDGGSTFWNSGLHQAITVFFPMKSIKRRDVCYAHEKRHIEDRVLNFCDIDDRETAGYLSGWLAPYFEELKDMYSISSEAPEQKEEKQ